MGMYDYVKYKDNCHVCGEPLSGFQSKNWLCDFLELEPVEVQKFQTSCKKCRAWHRYEVEREVSPECIKLINIHVVVEKFDHPIRRVPLKRKREGDLTGWVEQMKGNVLEIKEFVIATKKQVDAAGKNSVGKNR
jgi:hypothetical protein